MGRDQPHARIPGDDQALDLTRPLIDLGDLGITEMAFHRVFLTVAVAPKSGPPLSSPTWPSPRRRAWQGLLVCSVHRSPRPHPWRGQPDRSTAACLDPRLHVGQHPLDGLEAGDRWSNCTRSLAYCGQPRRLPRQCPPPGRQCRCARHPGSPARSLTRALFSQPMRGRQAIVLKDQLRSMRRSDPQFGFHFAGEKPGSLLSTIKAEMPRYPGSYRYGKENVIGVGSACHPGLQTIDDILVGPGSYTAVQRILAGRNRHGVRSGIRPSFSPLARGTKNVCFCSSCQRHGCRSRPASC